MVGISTARPFFEGTPLDGKTVKQCFVEFIQNETSHTAAYTRPPHSFGNKPIPLPQVHFVLRLVDKLSFVQLVNLSAT
jgi:hypothetical protein